MDAERTDERDESQRLRLVIFSFGFKHGVPVDANMLFDVRFLPNPYWQEHLRAKSGLEQEVSEYVVASDQGKDFLRLLKPLLLSVGVETVGARKELRIAIGCTGGRHRSVAVVEALAREFEQDSRFEVRPCHRDIDRDSH